MHLRTLCRTWPKQYPLNSKPLFPRQIMAPEPRWLYFRVIVYGRNSLNLKALRCCLLGLSVRDLFKASYLGLPLRTPRNALSPEYGHPGASRLVRCRGSNAVSQSRTLQRVPPRRTSSKTCWYQGYLYLRRRFLSQVSVANRHQNFD